MESRNQADGLVHSTEKALSEHGSKVSAEEKTAIEAALASRMPKGDDLDDIKAKTNTLAQASMKLGEAMYKAQQAEAGAASGAGDAPKADDNVVNAVSKKLTTTRKALPSQNPALGAKARRAICFITG